MGIIWLKTSLWLLDFFWYRKQYLFPNFWYFIFFANFKTTFTLLNCEIVFHNTLLVYPSNHIFKNLKDKFEAQYIQIWDNKSNNFDILNIVNWDKSQRFEMSNYLSKITDVNIRRKITKLRLGCTWMTLRWLTAHFVKIILITPPIYFWVVPNLITLEKNTRNRK